MPTYTSRRSGVDLRTMFSASEAIADAAEDRQVPYPSPESVIANVIADGRGAGADGVPRVGRATRKKAEEITRALRAAGWRLLR